MRLVLVEDTESDAEIVVMAASEYSVEVELCASLAEFDETFERDEAEGTQPDIFVIDLSIDADSEGGLGILRKLKSNSRVRHIPVVVISQSRITRMVYECYSSGANLYIHKSIEIDRFRDRMLSVLSLFVQDVRLPEANLSINFDDY